MKKITVALRELEALRWLAARTGIFEDGDRHGAKQMKILTHLMRKIEKSHEPRAKEIVCGSVGDLEAMLLNSGGRNVCKMGHLTVREYVLLGNEIRERLITEDQMRTLGLWLRDQPWVRSPFTLWQVVKKWGVWFAQAQAYTPRKSGPAMLRGD